MFEREVVFELDGSAKAVPTPFYDRDELRAGQTLAGPAVIEQYDSTTVVPPGLTAEIDRYGNIVIDCTGVARGRRRRSGAVEPRAHAGYRRRVPVDRQGDGRDPLPYLVLVDHPRVRGPRSRPVRRRGQRDRGIGLDADVHGRDAEDRQGSHPRARARRDPRGRHHRPQPPLQGRHPHAGHRHRRADLLGRRAGRLLGRVRPPRRHRRGLSGDGHRPRGHLVGGPHPRCDQALRARRPPELGVEDDAHERPRAYAQPRRHRGHDRGLRARQGTAARPPPPLRQGDGARRRGRLARLLRADAAPGDREGAGRGLRGRARLHGRRRQEPRQAAAGQGEGPDRGRQPDDRRHGQQRRGRDRVQQPLRGRGAQRCDVHRAHDLPRRGDARRLRPAERGDAAPGQA